MEANGLDSATECNLYIWRCICSLTVVFAPFFMFFFFFFEQFSSAVSKNCILTYYQRGITVGVCCAVFVSVLNTTKNILHEWAHLFDG